MFLLCNSACISLRNLSSSTLLIGVGDLPSHADTDYVCIGIILNNYGNVQISNDGFFEQF